MTSAELAAVPEQAAPIEPRRWSYQRRVRRSMALDALTLYASLTTEAIGWLTGGRVYVDAGVWSQPRIGSIDG
jgi:hypothetical protein